MLYYLPFVFIPALLVVVVSRFMFPHQITLKEGLLQFGGVIVSSLIAAGAVSMFSGMLAMDFNIYNGEVTDKESVHVSCDHQYQCGETCSTVTDTDAKGNKSTRQVCEPVYCDEHEYDVSWRVNSTLGTWRISRIDRQGLEEPPRWSIVEKGEPVSETRATSNYLLLDPKRFSAGEVIKAKYKDQLLEYPQPYDYWLYNRILNDNGQDYDHIKVWLDNQLKKDGALKELNVILVVTLNDTDYYYAMMDYWRGARKNDVIIFYGVDDQENIRWSKAISFADGQNNQIMLKNLQTMTYERKFDTDLVKEQYKLIVEKFQRIPNGSFEYMKKDWVPPMWWVGLIALFNLLGAIVVAYWVVTEDVA
jgi:hypothetical protein